MSSRPALCSQDAQKSVLGAILLDSTVIRRIPLTGLAIDDFLGRTDQEIYSAMLQLAEESNEAFDHTVLSALLEERGVPLSDAAEYLGQLIDAAAPEPMLKRHVEIIQRFSQLRRLRSLGETLQRDAEQLGADPARLLGKAESTVQSLRDGYDLQGHLLPYLVRDPGLTAISVEKLMTREIKPREMLLDPILPEQGLAMLYGYRGTGKTYIALGIAAAIASGGRFLKWIAPRQRKVLYVDGELPAKTVQERIAMILAGMEVDPGPDSFRIITPDLQGRPMPDIATSEGQRLIAPHLDGISVLVLDNLSALCREGKENEGEGWLPVQGWLLELRRRGISALFLHHAGKNKSQRGTSRREDLLDTIITLKHPENYMPSEGLRCEVHFEKTRGMLGNDARPFEVCIRGSEDNRAVWTFRELEEVKAEQAAELFAAGLSVREVAEELHISKSTAGRLRKGVPMGHRVGQTQ